MKWLAEEIEDLKRRKLFRELRSIESCQGTRVKIGEREVLNFSSNDYLSLACCRDEGCLRRWGSGSGASRLVCGNFHVHEELEERLSLMKKTEATLLFSTGYMANTGLISTLPREGDLIVSDELNHASIIDGCRLSKAKVAIYRHRNVEELELILSRERKRHRNCFIVTESVFSMDGDIAPLDEIFNLKREYEATLIVDDAHATGVVGLSSLDLFGLEPDEETVIVGTLGKAIGTFGAFVSGTKTLRTYLVNRCRSFIFTTALPPYIACQTLENLKRIPERMKVLKRKVSFFKKLTGIDSQSAIFPLVVGDEGRAVSLSESLYEKGFLVPAIRPPSVPKGTSRLRITVNYGHSEEDMRRLWEAIREAE